MSDIVLPLSPDLKLPWSLDNDQEKKFKRVLIRVTVPLMVFFLMIPWLPVFDITYSKKDLKIVKTKLILQREAVIEPPKPIETVRPKTRPKAESTAQATSKKKANKTKSKSASIMEKVGIAGFAKQLSALRGSLQVAKLSSKNVFTSKQGKFKKSTTTSLGEENALKTSGGIEVDNLTMGNSGGSLIAHKALEVDSPIMGIDLPSSRQNEYSSSQKGTRDMESIRKVFEQYKGGVYALYSKALRQYPELNGKFMFQLVIEADGSITDLKLIVSELGIKELEQNILAKINSIRFGAAAVTATAVQYKFVFLPH
ncbi:MAG: AgmX/PglI C-terminal domain-containing protein [Pseudomonadales bacterium]|nr:AgmX/PglI C-terminal domain-containing protein [Pseudomonadales bacterium]